MCHRRCRDRAARNTLVHLTTLCNPETTHRAVKKVVGSLQSQWGAYGHLYFTGIKTWSFKIKEEDPVSVYFCSQQVPLYLIQRPFWLLSWFIWAFLHKSHFLVTLYTSLLVETKKPLTQPTIFHVYIINEAVKSLQGEILRQEDSKHWDSQEQNNVKITSNHSRKCEKD